VQRNNKEKVMPGQAQADEEGKELTRGRAAKARESGQRGYLTKTDYHREFVLQVQVYAELGQSQGHTLNRTDLTRKFSQLLDSAILFAEDAQADDTFNPDCARQLSA
jgi:hypothetical protein